MQRTYRIGGERVSVRTTSPAFGEWLDEVLAPYRVRRRGRGYFDYSVAISGGDALPGSRGRRFHVLYQGVGALVRSLHAPTVGRALLAELARRACPDRDDAVYLAAALVAVGPGRAVLAPAWALPLLDRLGRRPARAGLAVAPATWTAVDPASGRVVPAPDLLGVPAGAPDALAALDGDGVGPDRPAVARPLRVEVVLTHAAGGDGPRPVSRGLALHRLSAAALNLEVLGGRAVEGLAGLARGARCYEMGVPARPQLLLDTILGLLGGRVDRVG